MERLRCEAEYDATLVEIEQYFRREPSTGSAEADRFNRLAATIADYETRRWLIDKGPLLST